jgi:chemotaxis protein methyltransferase WspC
LDEVRQIGDQGRVPEAIEACVDYLRRAPDSADGHFLLGVLHGAVGHRRASEAALRRAVYLDPQHAEALVHLALAHEAKGEAAVAARLRAHGHRAHAPGTEKTRR